MLGPLEKAVLRDLERTYDDTPWVIESDDFHTWGIRLDHRNRPSMDRKRYSQTLLRLERRGMVLRQNCRRMLRKSAKDQLRGKVTHVMLLGEAYATP